MLAGERAPRAPSSPEAEGSSRNAPSAPWRARSVAASVARSRTWASSSLGEPANIRLLAIVLRAQIEGDCRRLKVCASGTCRAVFYDRSDNLSKHWCRPRCDNRETSKRAKRRSRASFRRSQEAKRRDRRLLAE